MAKKKRSVYGKPLAKGAGTEATNSEQFKEELLEEVGEMALEEIKRELSRYSFSSPPTDLLESFEYEVHDSSISITSDHPAAKYLDEGVDPHQMTYLTKADRPIPIMTDNGEVIFRKATERSMADGSWYHPGIKKMNFVNRAVKRAREKVKKHVQQKYQSFVMNNLTD